MKVGGIVFVAMIFFGGNILVPALAQGPAVNFDTEKFVAAIRKSKVLSASQPIIVKRFQDAAVVTTLLNSKARADDCKIDAMLVSKAVMDVDKTIREVRYRLKTNMDSNAFYLISVKESDVKAYGASAIDKESLLAGLKVVPKTGPVARLKNFRKRMHQL